MRISESTRLRIDTIRRFGLIEMKWHFFLKEVVLDSFHLNKIVLLDQNIYFFIVCLDFFIRYIKSNSSNSYRLKHVHELNEKLFALGCHLVYAHSVLNGIGATLNLIFLVRLRPILKSKQKD